MVKQIFVNLPVKDLKRSVDFFTQLGFTFNPQFTDANATCMILGENMFAMLLVEDYFRTFTHKDIVDTGKQTEVLVALQLENREKVDEIVRKVLAAGGTASRPVQDLGFMYNQAIEDLDGHTWEFFHFDLSQMPSS